MDDTLLRVALVGGPMYDHLYRILDPNEVEVVVHEDHPTLNREVARRLAAGERIDVLATHSKYAPSQASWLLPLDDLLPAEALASLAPKALDLCRFEGRLLCLPRLIDVRILWVRRDRVSVVPRTWNDLVASQVRFGFPGRESGLFGTFFELVVGAGGALFDSYGAPTCATPHAVAAVETLRRLAERAPDDLPSWHYDDVDAALLDGRIDAAGAWPGAWGAIAASPFSDVFEPHPYPTGAKRWVSYAGCHGWAIPSTCGDIGRARQLVSTLIGADAQGIDAAGGNICAHLVAQRGLIATSPLDAARLEVTARTVDEAMITYPPLIRFPEIEDAGWSAIHDVLLGRSGPDDAVAALQTAAETVLATRTEETT